MQAETAGPRPIDPQVRKRQRLVAVLVFLSAPFLFGGALLYIASSPEGTHMELTVVESPSATGGVVLDAPYRTTIGGASGVLYRPWETHDLDPAEHREGDTVDVQVRSDCLCDPFIDDGSLVGQVVALALVGLGIASAGLAFVVNRWRGSPIV